MEDVPKLSFFKKEIEIFEKGISAFMNYYEVKPQDKQMSNIFLNLHQLFLNSKKKISIGLMGITKAGKSTLLNALIGSKILSSEVTACTSIALKLRPSLNKIAKFYEETTPQTIYTEENEIKKKMDEINKLERDQKSDSDIWILEIEIIGLSKSKEFQEIFEYIEFIDLPGIDDNYINNFDEKNENHYENIKKEVSNQQNIKLDLFKTKFNNLLGKISLDGVILLFDYLNQKNIYKFCKFLKCYLFNENHKSKFSSLFNKKNVLLVVNKYEPNKDEIKNPEENKKQLEYQIYRSLFVSKNYTFFQRFLNKFKKDEFDELFNYENENNYKEKCNLFPVNFVSSKRALDSFQNDNEKKHLMEYFSEKEAEEKIIENIKEMGSNFKYLSDSFFEELIPNLLTMFSRITISKIFSNFNAKYFFYLNESTKTEFINKLNSEKNKIKARDLNGYFEKIKNEERDLEITVKAIINNFNELVQQNAFTQENLKMFNTNEFISSFNDILNYMKTILEDFKKNISNFFQGLKIKDYLYEIINQETTPVLIMFNQILNNILSEILLIDLSDPILFNKMIFEFLNQNNKIENPNLKDLILVIRTDSINAIYLKHMDRLTDFMNQILMNMRNLMNLIIDECQKLK